MSIEVQSVTRRFGEFVALDGVSLHFPTGELVALLGPSGSGKTTLLRIIAGLDVPDSGQVLVHGAEAPGSAGDGPRVGFVFQHYALFRHMTVFDNVAFGLRVLPRHRRPSRAAIQDRVGELLRLVQLDGLARRYPSQLSGGQRQRIALARCLAVEPRLLLLDEPFGALDARVRKELRSWLRQLHEQIGLTSVFVTHDQEEAMEVADRVVIMNAGRIEQVGTPEDVFREPATEFVVNFVGNVNLFHGRVEGGKAHFSSLSVDWSASHGVGTSARVFVRPHDFDVALSPGSEPSIPGEVRRVHTAGPRVKLDVQTSSGESVEVEIAQDRFQDLGVAAGSPVFLRPREIKVFTEDYSI